MIAPFVLSGAIVRDAFDAYVKQVLVLELRPGDVVVMDNLSSHKDPKTRKMIEDAGMHSSSCRPTVRTSIPSNLPSQSSRPSSEKPPREPSTVSGTLSANSPSPSRRKNAETASTPPDTSQYDRIPH